MIKISVLTLMLFALFILIININYASAQANTVCCEKTDSNLYCQNVPSSECAAGAKQAPTSCKTASFCKPGTCYSSTEGTCTDNTPQIVCNNAQGIWTEKSPPQCSLGCCVLGDQAAFVSLVRCKRLAGFLGLQTNYRKDIKNEVACVLSVQNQEKGACVFEFEFEKSCKFTTRSECEGPSANATGGVKGEFFNGKLCSAEELGTTCGPTTKTVCLPGKDEVYFVDSCGNTANIYDSSKVNDKEYWANIKDKSEACSPNSANANSKSCGNCNYLQGSICRKTEAGDTKATYGDNICSDLNCKNTDNGKSYKHGESWCVYSDQGEKDKSNNAVGSRFFKHICVNGEEVLEQCADFRTEECVENTLTVTGGSFSQAACRVNRWQDCLTQIAKDDCENTDKRDCIWKAGISLQRGVSGGNASGTTATGEEAPIQEEIGTCVPKNTPGLKFWEGNEVKGICAQGNAACIVSFEKGLFGGEKCKGNCTCLDDSWIKQREEICVSLGDCGPKVNWLGQKGYKAGFKTKVEEIKKDESTSSSGTGGGGGFGGLFGG